MSYSIKWLPEAEFTYALVLDYLEENWTRKEVLNFIDRTEEVVAYIAKRPKQYVYSRKKEAYRAVVTRHTSLFYRIKSDEVELLVFWDNRQNPEKLKL